MSIRWKARIRPEYIWPYPALEIDQWYPVRAGSLDPSADGWTWLATMPQPTYVNTQHFDFERWADAEAAGGDGGHSIAERPGPVRLARVRAGAAGFYPHLSVQLWYRARDLIALVSPPAVANSYERRLLRIRSDHFEFRDDWS